MNIFYKRNAIQVAQMIYSYDLLFIALPKFYARHLGVKTLSDLDKLEEDDEILMDPELSTALCDLIQQFLHCLRMLAGVHTRLPYQQWSSKYIRYQTSPLFRNDKCGSGSL
jgi:hypothetical protein